MKTWNKIHVDPTKRGNPNGGESENTRLNYRNVENSEIHGTRARVIKYNNIIFRGRVKRREKE